MFAQYIIIRKYKTVFVACDIGYLFRKTDLLVPNVTLQKVSTKNIGLYILYLLKKGGLIGKFLAS